MEVALSIDEQADLLKKITRNRSFGRFADRLGEVIFDIWSAAATVGLKGVTEFLATSGKYTAGDFDELNEILRASLVDDFGDNLSPIVRGASRTMYVRGSDEIRRGLIRTFDLVDNRAVSWLHQHHMFWSLERFDSDTTERLRRLSEVAIKNGLSRRNAGRFFNNTIGRELKGKRNAQYWELTADAISTRARSFGSISAFEKAGVKKYIISIVDDHRTSDICLYLGGKEVFVEDEDGTKRSVQLSDTEREFDTRDAIALRDKLVAAENPEAAKEIAPWKSPKFVVGKFPKDLTRAGIMTPPFHGRCRSRLVIA